MAIWNLARLTKAIYALAAQVKRIADQQDPAPPRIRSGASHVIHSDLSRIAVKARLYRAAKTEGLSRAQAKAKVRHILERSSRVAR